MKKRSIFRVALFLACIFSWVPAAMAGTARFAVISDPHVYDRQLGDSGTAFEAYLAKDRKMIRESEAILKAAVEAIIAAEVDFVLVSGDLTKDGEAASHELCAKYLKLLEENGTAVYVVPGNHDIQNPHAVAYSGDTTMPTENVTPDRFTEIYADFGYTEAIARDPGSLSYVVEPAPGVWVLGLDSTDYDDNGEEPETGGRFKADTLTWIEGQLAKAKRRGKTVFAFLHHGLTEHFEGQIQAGFGDYVIDAAEAVSERLSQAGLTLAFTGHFHANDITKVALANADSLLYDVETGSLVTAPCPYRIVTLHGKNAVTLESRTITEIDWDTGGKEFAEYARAFLREGLVGIAAYTLMLPVDQGGFGFDASDAAAIAPDVADAFIAHYTGDETPDVAIQAVIAAYLSSADPRRNAIGRYIGSLWTDLVPADNRAYLSLTPAITLNLLGTYKTGAFDEGAAEIPAYDPITRRVFVVNGADRKVDILNVKDPQHPVKIGAIDCAAHGDAATSVAVHQGVVAVAVKNDPSQAAGRVAFFDTSGNLLKAVTVGALPDMLTFTPDGKYVLVANEGEPSDDYATDPEGSVCVIDLTKGVKRAKVQTADFTRFNRSVAWFKKAGLRVFGPNATLSQDMEPEYIAVSPDGHTAWVSLQENNAMALLDIKRAEIKGIYPLGEKDHGFVENALDPSNKDDGIRIAPHAGVYGMFQPDAIAAFKACGKEYILSANEGDSRDYDAFSEEVRVGKLTLDPAVFPDTAKSDAQLGRLLVTRTLGDSNGDGRYESLHAFGGRSFSIWQKQGTGLRLVFDSGAQMEEITAAALPLAFNTNNDDNDSFDGRSDDKGPEPEGICIGTVGHRTYAFICLERIGGILVYEITDPRAPTFVHYLNPRDFGGDAQAGTAGDLGPEGMAFIDARHSPTGEPLLVVANEVSGSTTFYAIKTE